VMALLVSKAGVKISQLTEPPITPHLYLYEQGYDSCPGRLFAPSRIGLILKEDANLLRVRKAFTLPINA
jgi:hypothetical protein